MQILMFSRKLVFSCANAKPAVSLPEYLIIRLTPLKQTTYPPFVAFNL